MNARHFRRPPCRLSLRASVAVPAHVAISDGGHVLPTRAVIENLSDGGTLVRSQERFEEGARITISLRPGTDARLDLHGCVVRASSRRYHAERWYGVRFVDVGSAQSAALSSYVGHLIRAQFMRAPG